MRVIQRVGPTVPICPVFSSTTRLVGRPDAYPIPNDCIDFTDAVGVRNGVYSTRAIPFRYLKRTVESVLADDFGVAWGRLIASERPKVRLWLLGERQP